MVPGYDAAGEVLFGGIELIIPFWKVQTIGNDFVLIEADSMASGLYSSFAEATCSRSYGIGADGLLVVGPDRFYGADIWLKMFNPDGTEDFCGNGLRCAGMFSAQQGWVNGNFTIHHLDRTVAAHEVEGLISATLPPADFSSAAVPVSTRLPEFVNQMVEGVHGTAVSTGTAHFVAFVDELPEDRVFRRVSQAIETNPLFPERTSIMWSKRESDHRIRLRIWERGVGETLGCGTGSSAVAAVQARTINRGGEFEIINLGGSLIVSLDDWQSPITSRSRPEIVYTGSFDFR